MVGIWCVGMGEKIVLDGWNILVNVDWRGLFDCVWCGWCENVVWFIVVLECWLVRSDV